MSLVALVKSAIAEPHAIGQMNKVDVKFAPQNTDLTFTDLVWSRTIDPHAETHEIRVRFSDLSLPEGSDFQIEIADQSGRVHDVLQHENLDGRSEVWSLIVPGNIASVRVRGRDATNGLAFRIDRVLFPFNMVAPEAFFGPGQLQDVALYNGDHSDVVKHVESSVAKIDYVVDDQGDTCTAFRIAQDLIQTSAHCVSTEEICATTTVRFGFKKSAFGAVDLGEQMRCAELIAEENSDGADTAILRIVPKPEERFAIVEFREHDPLKDEELFIIQHPGGEAKKVSIVECAVFNNDVTAAHPHAFGHSCDTKAGSSGAPVFALDGRVVGQQRAGHRNPDVTDQPNLATFGSLLAILNAAPNRGPIAATQNTKGAPLPLEEFQAAQPLPLPVSKDHRQEIEDLTGDVSIGEPGSPGSETIPPRTD